MKKILLTMMSVLLLVVGAEAQVWVSLKSLQTDVSMQDEYTTWEFIPRTISVFMQDVPTQKIRITDAKGNGTYIFSELPNGQEDESGTIGVYSVNVKKGTIEVSLGGQKQTVKMKSLPKSDNGWYEYDFGRTAYLSITSGSTLNYDDIQMLITPEQAASIKKKAAYIHEKYSPALIDLFNGLEVEYVPGEGEKFHHKLDGSYEEHELRDYCLLLRGAALQGIPLPLDAFSESLIGYSINLFCGTPLLEEYKTGGGWRADPNSEEIMKIKTYAIATLSKPEVTKLDRDAIADAINSYKTQKKQANRQTFLAEREASLMQGKGDIIISRGRMFFRYAGKSKGLMQKWGNMWYYASDTDEITNVTESGNGTTKVEYTMGDYILIDNDWFSISEARVHREIDGKKGVLTVKRGTVTIEFDNGDKFSNYWEGALQFKDMDELKFTSDLRELLQLQSFNQYGITSMVLAKNLVTCNGTMTLADGTTEKVENGDSPSRRAVREAARDAEIAPWVNANKSKIIGNWKFTSIFRDAYDRCDGLGFAMSIRFNADGTFCKTVSYAPPALKNGLTFKFDCKGTWKITGNGQISLTFTKFHDNEQIRYIGNDRYFAYKFNNWNDTEKSIFMVATIEQLGILGGKSIYRCDMFDEIVINGNTMTGYYSDSDWYGRTGWYNIKMTKIK